MENKSFEDYKGDESNISQNSVNFLIGDSAVPNIAIKSSKKKGTSDTETLMHMVKANVGTGRLLDYFLFFK